MISHVFDEQERKDGSYEGSNEDNPDLALPQELLDSSDEHSHQLLLERRSGFS